MKKIKLCIYNYGLYPSIADFKGNSHDAIKTMKYLNTELVTTHGALPEKIFYYLEYNAKSGRTYMVDFNGKGDHTACPQQELIRIKSST